MKTTKNIKKIIDSISKNAVSNIAIKTSKTKILFSKEKNQTRNLKKSMPLHKTDKSKLINYKNKIQELIPNQIDLKLDEKSKIKPKSGLYSTIISPMVGTFYKSPAPNESAFVEIGDSIKPKQLVCIIEAMKLMNEIESEVKGEIVEILVKDGDIVDCGQALIKVKVE
uniref:Biotin carboxyl carrier protein of acetyl-CoA carboxylase n=1 Tax=Polysiphonia sertularioides TaxID=945028 RepID=A0A1Z1M952_9FLOR|nr:acetyl-CoA carboxylase biotin carboxyl carrier protein [Polysiphonia sertularioides]ARW62516.1 acetyl-CoA carboxylase biotin carboxyl carrier protein [Polysiphonia sertularioides]